MSKGATVMWRLNFSPVEYGCRDASGSLYPVPPGSTRWTLGFCERCQAERCLFTGSLTPLARARVKAEREARQEAKRLEALEAVLASGERLACWYCVQVRAWRGGYVCRLHPDEEPVSQSVMAATVKPECGCFELRRAEVQEITQKALWMARRNVRYRQAGLSSQNTPLTHCCWNCVHIRRNGLYVCQFAPEDPASTNVMIRREICRQFELRRSVVIPALGF